MGQTPNYLEQLNQGRKRRSSTSIEELNRTLAELEDRVGLMSARADWYPPRGRQAYEMPGTSGFNPYRNMADDLERTRRQEEDLALLSQIANEMQEMRAELRTQLHRPAQKDSSELIEALRSDMERLAGAVADMAERGDDRTVGLIRLDLDDVRAKLERLSQDNEALAELTSKLGATFETARDVPVADTSALDDRIRMLAEIVDAMAEQQTVSQPAILEAIEVRLDEIARAIAAAGQADGLAPSFDTSAFDRIEARVSTLARHMEALASHQGDPAVAAQVARLAGQIDQLAQRPDLSEDTVIRLANQIALMADRLDGLSSSPRTEAILTDVVARLDTLDDQQRGLFDAIESRMAALAGQIDRMEASGPRGLGIEMEERLADMAERVELAAQSLSRLDPDLVGAMQEQLQGLSALASRPDAQFAALEALSPRLDQIERAIDANRERLVEAASRATAEALKSTPASAAIDAEGLSRLAVELQKLDQLTRRSDERNTRTFEAIHDTLLKVVDRLDSIAATGAMRPASVGLMDTPPLVPDIDGPQEDAKTLQRRLAKASGERPVPRKPAQEAEADMPLPVATAATPEGSVKPRGSLLAGLSGAFRRKPRPDAAADRTASPIASLANEEAEAPSLDLPDNRPLEPGSGAPDLNAIMRRVRDERSPAQPSKDVAADPSKSDFIAAARRAAQAAAAEAESMRGKPEKRGGGLKRLLPSGRKTVMLGLVAVLVGLGSLQFVSSLRQDAGDQPQIAALPAAEPAREAAPSLAAAPAAPTEIVTVGSTGSVRSASREPTPIANAAPIPQGPAAKLASIDAAPMGTASPLTMPETGAAPAFDVPLMIEPAALREAASEGDPLALHAIGERYADGIGIARDMGEAALWFERAAEAGFAPAQYRVANMYEKGNGVERDYGLAMEWYEQAAEQGNATAMHNLAVLHATGPTGKVDNETAARLFRAAAERGVRDSQFNMGILAVRGIGTEQSFAESYKWFAIVAAGGDADAAAKRDEVGKVMTAEDLERTRAEAEAWRPTPLDPDANEVDMPAEWQASPPATAAAAQEVSSVADVQRLLNAAGYDAGSADGIMGERTRQAIAAWQRDRGLPATGELDGTQISAITPSR